MQPKSDRQKNSSNVYVEGNVINKLGNLAADHFLLMDQGRPIKREPNRGVCNTSVITSDWQELSFLFCCQMLGAEIATSSEWLKLLSF